MGKKPVTPKRFRPAFHTTISEDDRRLIDEGKRLGFWRTDAQFIEVVASPALRKHLKAQGVDVRQVLDAAHGEATDR